ncbi:branched-chain amino acid ABC transporter permease [Natronorubrum thiooxidans]|uniref:Amino acid/amide ABC transporter membrane protein 1, HAAT family n=1 Tax=Natronorubrum thiooxidans TaxID=308853 RepID=A0A1N7GYG4_9EURY|nr:branched-chain amino acid ABC transporter permease [Natronorubrum thiooxidans]SIS17602.1 amino acid/amide ABC transporter membrane protein 1, HAAT family [Natronorubrum thiooxidans]
MFATFAIGQTVPVELFGFSSETAAVPLFIDLSIGLQLLAFAILLGGIYGLVALGLTMIFGVMDVINFAHGALMVVGMYAVWWMTNGLGLNPFLTIPIAVALLFVFGVLIHLTTIAPIIDASQENQLIVTFGVLLIIVSTIEIAFSADPQSLDIDLGSVGIAGIYLPEGQLYALVFAILAVIVSWAFLQYTQLGRAIRGTADNRDAAQYVGINVPRIDYLTFGLGAALAGLAGAVIPLFQQINPHLGDAYLINAFVIVVLGGLGSFPGALLGGMIIGFVHVFGQFYLPGSGYQIAIFCIFILVLLLKPSGLLGGDSNE